MNLDPRLTLLLSGLPGTLDELLAHLASPTEVAERPWLPALGDYTAENASLWLLVLDAIEPFVASTDYITQHKALKVLARCPIPQSGELAAPFLADDRSIFVVTACDAVARSGMPGAARIVAELLAHADGQIRWRAAGNLGATGDPTCAADLRRLLQAGDPEPLVIRWGAVSLGDVGTSRDRDLLEAVAERTTDSLARDGLRAALEALGVIRDDLSPFPDLARAVRGAADGDAASVAWLVRHYRDPAFGEGARTALLGAPPSIDDALVDLVASRGRDVLFGAADAVGWRGVRAGIEALRSARDTGYDPPGMLAASAALVRLGDADAVSAFTSRWVEDIDPPDRAQEIGQALFLAPPLPAGFLAALLADPCAWVTATAAELVRREARKDLLEPLLAAVERERARVEGEGDPRDPYDNDFAAAASLRSDLVHRGAALREQLPAAVRDAAEALEREELADAHVLAARALLHAVTGFGRDFADAPLRTFFTSRSALLRFDALKLWAGGFGALPDHSFADDEHPAVRALWESLGG